MLKEKLKIEIPTIDDREAIDKIAVQVHECHVKWRPDIFESTNTILSEEELVDRIGNNTIFVAKVEDRIVGYMLLSSREVKKKGYRYRKELDIDAIGVEERHRNQGIGNALLEYVKNYAKSNYYTDLRLTVDEENDVARHVYEKIGFRIKNIAYSMKLK